MPPTGIVRHPVRFSKLTFLGTCSATPTKSRNVSGCTLSMDDGVVWLFDCGEATQQQIIKSPIAHSKIRKIFITHLHGDHCFGLPGLMCTLSMGRSDKFGEQNPYTSDDQAPPPKCADAPEEPIDTTSTVLDIYGPHPIGQYIRSALRLTYSYLTFSYRVHEAIPDTLTEDDIHNYMQNETHANELKPKLYRPQNHIYSFIDTTTYEAQVKAAILNHIKGVFCIGYSITEPIRPGKMDGELIQKLNVPGQLRRQLKEGQSVTLPDGKIVHPEDVMGPNQLGRTVVILGDTCNSENMLQIGQNAEILVHESTFEDSMIEMALSRGHSTAGMAGTFARQLNAKKLVITHFSARYASSSDDSQENKNKKSKVDTSEPSGIELLVHQASTAFNSSNVVAAEDFMEIPI